LDGNEPAYISKATNHSVDAVSGYLQPFKRVVALTLEGKDKTSIAFLLSISKPLVTRYQELFEQYKDEALHTRIREMEGFLKKIFLEKKDPVQVARETDCTITSKIFGFNLQQLLERLNTEK
jgi:predicted transcriptional regulator